MTTPSAHPPADEPREQTEDDTVVQLDVHTVGYDAQTDLALPEPAAGDADTVFTPYAGSVVDDAPVAAYDIDKDVAT